MTDSLNVTQLLMKWGDGDPDARDRLVPLVYEELHRLARRHLRREGPAQTLRSTALVHEAYLRLVDQDRAKWQNRAHFFGIAARLMRRILVDRARARVAAKRGGGAAKVTLDDEVGLGVEPSLLEIAELDRVLAQLETFDPQQAKVVELRFFGGLTIEETAAALEISAATVKREWSMARAWLHRELRRED